jgi:hypothetical protein
MFMLIAALVLAAAPSVFQSTPVVPFAPAPRG